MGQGSSRSLEPSSSDRQSHGRSLSLRPSLTLSRRQHDRADTRLSPSLFSLRSPRNGNSPSQDLQSNLRRRTTITTSRLSRNRMSNLFNRDPRTISEDSESTSASRSTQLSRIPLPQPAEQDNSPPTPPILGLEPSFETSSVTTATPPPPPPETPRLRPQRSPHTIADRISSLTPDRGFRSMTASLRRRRSPLRSAEDPSVALTRLLSLAAQATAASLLGRNPENAMADLRGPNGGIEGDDGTFNGFLQALQNGRFAAALNQDERSPGDEGAGDDEDRPATFEFFRMFRFGSSSVSPPRPHMHASSRPSSSRSVDHDGETSIGEDAPTDEDSEHRMVPILIVGVRALGEADEPLNGEDGNVPSFFDAFTNGPTTVSLGLGENPPADDLLPLPQETSRNSHRRRASMGGFNLFSHNRESARHPRTSSNRSRSEIHNLAPVETPPGPIPPPTTPSSPGLSAFSSETSTPTRRSSFSTSGSLNTSSRRNSLIRRMGGTPLEPTAEESTNQPRPSRRRRSSEPDVPHFGSGSSRRNGVLMEPRDSPTEGHRSWIIYILGRSYPENHPILTTPSLFTDSPTYEDMILLSSLLGQAKPPVANAEDVESAGGLFRIKMINSVPMAIEESGQEQIRIAVGEQCLVCLSDFQEGEEARRLIKCHHLFHRECIDHWLTTGRNSCPLCRRQGVDEKRSEEAENDRTSGTQSTPVNSL